MKQAGICKLCEEEAPLVESHIIPKFVTDHLKRTSSTGFLRTNDKINRRAQDGFKVRMLCDECEGILNSWETPFSSHIYHPLNNNGDHLFEYGSWCLKFAASISWRALTYWMEKASASDYSAEAVSLMQRALRYWKEFMFEERPHPGSFQQHMLFLDLINPTADSTTFPPNINGYLSRAVQIDYRQFNNHPAFIFTKMGKVGLFGFLGIEHPRSWVGTQIHVRSGTIGGNVEFPSEVTSYLSDQASPSFAVRG